jgi:hypothetical protein
MMEDKEAAESRTLTVTITAQESERVKEGVNDQN